MRRKTLRQYLREKADLACLCWLRGSQLQDRLFDEARSQGLDSSDEVDWIADFAVCGQRRMPWSFSTFDAVDSQLRRQLLQEPANQFFHP